MVSAEYSEAAVEVLDILKHTSEEDVEKIPKKFLEFLESNKSKTYIPKLDHTKTIKEMNLKPKTEALLGLIYLKYWANDEEKIAFKNRAKENEIKYQEGLREKYHTDNLFKKEIIRNENIQQKMSLQTVEHETFIRRIINKIKGMLRRERY